MSAAFLLVGLLAHLASGGPLAQHYLHGWWRGCQGKPLVLSFALAFVFLASYVLILTPPFLRAGRGIGVAAALALLFGAVSLLAGFGLVATVPLGLALIAGWQTIKLWGAGQRGGVLLGVGGAVLVAGGLAIALLLRCQS